MGLYINPKDEPKEAWVLDHAMPLDETALRGWKYDANPVVAAIVPIVVIDNGAFRAVGVLYSAKERERFLSSLDYKRTERRGRRARPMWFGFATVEDVRKVSDYDDYVGGD
jgi:hypothetical protein